MTKNSWVPVLCTHWVYIYWWDWSLWHIPKPRGIFLYLHFPILPVTLGCAQRTPRQPVHTTNFIITRCSSHHEQIMSVNENGKIWSAKELQFKIHRFKQVLKELWWCVMAALPQFPRNSTLVITEEPDWAGCTCTQNIIRKYCLFGYFFFLAN